MRAAAFVTAVIGLVGLAAYAGEARAAASDSGIMLEIDAVTYSLRATDLASGETGPELLVTLGSPSHRTPFGRYRPRGVIHRPAWMPSARARRAGIRPMPPSESSPMGIAKIPLTRDGSIALHGAGTPLLLGKPASSGCIRLSDAGMLELLAWLEARAVLGDEHELRDGSSRQSFRRPVRVTIQ